MAAALMLTLLQACRRKLQAELDMAQGSQAVVQTMPAQPCLALMHMPKRPKQPTHAKLCGLMNPDSPQASSLSSALGARSRTDS